MVLCQGIILGERVRHLTDLVVVVTGDLDEAFRLTGMDGELGRERLRSDAATNRHRGHLDELGAGIVHHLDTEQPLVLRLEYQLEVSIVLAHGAPFDAPRMSCVATWHWTPLASTSRRVRPTLATSGVVKTVWGTMRSSAVIRSPSSAL